jgi:hypothetical protein
MPVVPNATIRAVRVAQVVSHICRACSGSIGPAPKDACLPRRRPRSADSSHLQHSKALLQSL